MDQKHYNELVMLSQEIYDQAADKLTNYCSARYCGISSDTTEQQLEDYLFVAEGTSAYLFGNALALLEPDDQEAEIKSFVEDLRRVISYAQKKPGSDQKPNGRGE
jgi:hypothetical protein